MQAAVEKRIFPGAVLLVSRAGELAFHRPYGWADLFSRRAMTADTLFDLASLTKPLGTTLAIMLLVEQNRLTLDRPCGNFCTSLANSALGRLTLRQMLSHRSGLPAWRPYYMHLRFVDQDRRRTVLRAMLLREQVRFDANSRSEYSDLGFMVLQWLVEECVGSDLASFLHQHVYRKLGIQRLLYVGNRNLPADWFAATELCPWRNRLIAGNVHDDNASVMGGVAGHAGLFGSAQAIEQVLQGLMDGEHAGHSLFGKDLIQTFFERQSGDTWALGYDTPSAQNSSAGSFFSPLSVGHLGFTGTSFWMDRDCGVICVLLTNRVHPSRYDIRIKGFRPTLHNAVMEALGSKVGGARRPH